MAKEQPQVQTREADPAAEAARKEAGEAATAAERARIDDILEVGARFNLMDEAKKAIRDGVKEDAFRKQVLEKISNVRLTPVHESPDLGLTERERKNYSLCRAILAAADRSWKRAGFEKECSVAMAEKIGRDPQGFFIPWDVMDRDFVAAQMRAAAMQNPLTRDLLMARMMFRDLTKTTEGADLIATDLMTGSLIELLRNRMVTRLAGARMLTGLQGDIAIPRLTTGATGFWVAEATAPTESTQVFDQVAMAPNTVGTFTDISRKLLIQSSLDVEGFVRQDIIDAIAVELDQTALNGSGSGAEPLGISGISGIGDVDFGLNGGAPTWAFIVEFESDVAAANADIGSLAYIVNAVTRGKLKTVEKAANTAEFLWDMRGGATPLNGYPAFVTNSLRSNLTKGTGSALSEMVFGNWADLLFGLWTGTDVLVDPFTGGTAGLLRIIVLQDADIDIRRAASFSYANEVITA